MPSLPVVIVVSPLSSIVKDQVTYLRSHGFEAAFIGESAKQDNDIFEGKIKCHFLYGSPESFVRDIKFSSGKCFHSSITGRMLWPLSVTKFTLWYTGKKL